MDTGVVLAITLENFLSNNNEDISELIFIYKCVDKMQNHQTFKQDLCLFVAGKLHVGTWMGR